MNALDTAGPTAKSLPGEGLQVVVFTVDRQRYALRLHVVERVLRMVDVSPLPKAPAVVLGVLNVHGKIVPVLDIRRRFGLSSVRYGLTSCLVVARTTRRTLALPVDEVLGVQTVTPDLVMPPDAVMPGIGLVEGIAALSDGILFIHDLEAFFSTDEEQRLTEALDGRTQ
jgi:purine-binding chemotaxis protein CheW